eukprot:760567-Hanusia_phi.AAC.4
MEERSELPPVSCSCLTTMAGRSSARGCRSRHSDGKRSTEPPASETSQENLELLKQDRAVERLLPYRTVH